MATTYATTTQLKARLKIPATSVVSDTTLQALLDTAAQAIDAYARRYIVGKEAFAATGSETRYFDDPLDTEGLAYIDDLLTVTEIVRGTTTITASYYDLWPYNLGNACYTAIRFTQDSTSPVTAGLNSRYNYPFMGVGTKQLSVTGTWGFCTEANRPAIVTEATLIQAGYLYEIMNLSKDDVVQLGLSPRREPVTGLHPAVPLLLAPIKAWGRSGV
jgi:hypothetical protein